MKVTFNEAEREYTKAKLKEADIPATDANIKKALDAVAAAFQQQFESETEYLINELDEDKQF